MKHNKNDRYTYKYRFRYYLALTAFLLTLLNFFIEVVMNRLQLVDIVLLIAGIGVFAIMKTLWDKERKEKNLR